MYREIALSYSVDRPGQTRPLAFLHTHAKTHGQHAACCGSVSAQPCSGLRSFLCFVYRSPFMTGRNGGSGNGARDGGGVRDAAPPAPCRLRKVPRWVAPSPALSPPPVLNSRLAPPHVPKAQPLAPEAPPWAAAYVGGKVQSSDGVRY